jgi:hypothetical protein
LTIVGFTPLNKGPKSVTIFEFAQDPEVLSFRSQQYESDAQLSIVVSTENPDGTALLLEPRGDSFVREFQERVYSAGLPIIVFGVNDLPGEIGRLKNHGVEFREDLIKKKWSIESLFEDSFGNLLMLEENP